MLAAALVMAAAPGANVHGARVPTLNQVRTAIVARGRDPEAGTKLRVSDERCSPVDVPRRERESRRAVAAARCSFLYGEVALPDPAARPARWRRQHAYFYLVGTPCGGEGQEADLTCYSWTIDRELTLSGAEAL
ncbi:MAG: hypothetical protein QOD42_442 [Sphingomonadales bacterium]|jgi:hypothetical protein|nr:hypothetical protein [Sphingomonadales bacterium]